MRRPACIDDDEWALWRAANEAPAALTSWAESPCIDCLPGFAAEMRDAGRCDGTPGVGRVLPTITLIGRGYPGYASEEERRIARRQTWRERSRRQYRLRLSQSAAEALQ